jgi:hypothetical protein
MLIRFLPGFVAAVAAYLAMKLIGWVGQSLSFEILLFFGTYVVVTVIVDAAMKKYGEKKS